MAAHSNNSIDGMNRKNKFDGITIDINNVDDPILSMLDYRDCQSRWALNIDGWKQVRREFSQHYQDRRISVDAISSKAPFDTISIKGRTRIEGERDGAAVVVMALLLPEKESSSEKGATGFPSCLSIPIKNTHHVCVIVKKTAGRLWVEKMLNAL
ncbi:hypothetical protein R6Q59_025110 [Mikania micrantha]